MTILVDTPSKTYPTNIKAFIKMANAALTIILINMRAMAGLESWQIRLGSRHLAHAVSFFPTELEFIASEDGGRRRGRVSDELIDTTVESIISKFMRSVCKLNRGTLESQCRVATI